MYIDTLLLLPRNCKQMFFLFQSIFDSFIEDQTKTHISTHPTLNQSPDCNAKLSEEGGQLGLTSLFPRSVVITLIKLNYRLKQIK